MPELAIRLSCPVCLGITMEKVTIGPDKSLQIDHCPRCSGVWFEHGEVQRLRAIRKGDVRRSITPERVVRGMRCHDCHAPLDRADERCPACGWANVLDCPACSRPMHVESHAGLRLDVCRGCKGVWFDHHELEAIWGASFDRALGKRSMPAVSRAGNAASEAGDALFDVLFFAPDLVFLGAHVAGQAMVASAHIASSLPGAVAAAPEAAASIFEAAGEAAGSVFEAIVEIIAGLF